ncbi:hypothetical protein Athena1_0040 [Vibrio phage Athena1]|nr:hypothetical protein Athena1_0040 [Vibrio phage Athena1]
MAHKSLEEIIDICKRQGLAFEASADFSGANSISAGESSKIIFITGSKPVIFYGRRLSFSGVGVNAYIYRDPVYTGGTPATIEVNNANDINPKTELSSFVIGATITDDGVLSRAPVYIYANESRQGKGLALESIDDPQLMPPNSVYLFVLENRDQTSAQDFASIVQFVEPDKIPGLVLDENGNFVSYTGEELLY